MERNEAIEVVRKNYPHVSESGTQFETALRTLVPELRESEYERIRKELLEHCKKLVPGSEYKKHQSWVAWLEMLKEPEDKGEISDGYHTFNELYRYRMLYNAAFFNLLPKQIVHKSKRHHDGEKCFGGGWFIVMANLPTGQISNHYELKDWDLFQIPEKEVADEWDGHTPQEAAERLHEYLLEKQGKQKPSWSDEDEKMFDMTEINLRELRDRFGEGYGRVGDCIDWLKSLKARLAKSCKDEPKFKVGDNEQVLQDPEEYSPF